jgi:exopolyphosphatase/guanosine-5'-triphosphate,3'-diphosphate pyrophosphatase
VRRACIDIGSNTTRLLVADCHGGRLQEVHQERAFTRIGRAVLASGSIPAAKIDDIVSVVEDQIASARELGADPIRAVATAGIRRAGNGDALIDAVRERCGLAVEVLTGEQEARLAFLGAAATLGHDPDGSLGVVDVGGGSSEVVIGTAPERVEWYVSFAVGSGDLADDCLRSDPPSQEELSAARKRACRALGALKPPRPREAVAVGGSAASLRRLAGPVLDGAAFARALGVLASARTSEVARRFGLDVERVRLLPAGLLILQAASELLGSPLQVGRGGVREGILLSAGSV